MELSVHRRFQAPKELHARGTSLHASWSVSVNFSLVVLQAMPAENVWPSHSNLCSARSQVSAAVFLCPDLSSYGHGSVQRISGLFACKQRVGDAISVKTLVRLSPGLPNLLDRPCPVRYTDATRVVVSTDVGCCS